MIVILIECLLEFGAMLAVCGGDDTFEADRNGSSLLLRIVRPLDNSWHIALIESVGSLGDTSGIGVTLGIK